MAWTNTKTAVVVGVGVLIVASAVVTPRLVKKAAIALQVAQVEKRKATHDTEIVAERERIKSRQAVNETSGATTIDLRPYINAKLTESPVSPKGNNENNLAELPAGVNIYAGVPFDVEGFVQLTGKLVKNGFPLEVDNIKIGKRCAKLHVFHGCNWVLSKNFGRAVAKLVLHYEDGSERSIDMIAGKQVFDWWFPLFKTGVPDQYFPSDPGTERAWTGSNPYLLRPIEVMKNWDVKQRSLILYKSTFANPQPDVAITSMDYVTARTVAGPFMLGLTVE